MSELISSSKRADNLKLAIESYNKAKRKSSTTLTRWSPDWEQACRYYRDAIKYYKLSGVEYEKELIPIYIESSIAHEAFGIHSYHTAAQHLEAAADLMVKYKNPDTTNIIQRYRESSRLYRLNNSNSVDQAVKVLLKCVDGIGEIDIQESIHLLTDAISIYEDENRGELSDHTFKRAIIYMTKHQRYDDAIALLKRQQPIYLQHINTFEGDLYRNYLSIIVLRFVQRQYERAEQELHEYEQQNPRFVSSNECKAAEQLIDSYNHHADNEELQNVIKNNTFKYLVAPIATLVRKLKYDDSTISINQGAASKNKKKYDDIVDDDDDDDEREEVKNNMNQVTNKLKSTQIRSSSDNDDSDEEVKPSRKTKQNKSKDKTREANDPTTTKQTKPSTSATTSTAKPPAQTINTKSSNKITQKSRKQQVDSSDEDDLDLT